MPSTKSWDFLQTRRSKKRQSRARAVPQISTNRKWTRKPRRSWVHILPNHLKSRCCWMSCRSARTRASRSNSSNLKTNVGILRRKYLRPETLTEYCWLAMTSSSLKNLYWTTSSHPRFSWATWVTIPWKRKTNSIRCMSTSSSARWYLISKVLSVPRPSANKRSVNNRIHM